jgi:hypothetical protein
MADGKKDFLVFDGYADQAFKFAAEFIYGLLAI